MTVAKTNHVSLREYLDTKFAALEAQTATGDALLGQRIGELEKRIDERTQLLLAQNERDKGVLNERLSTMNEFRGQLRDQASNFVTREILDEKLKLHGTRLDQLEGAKNVQEGRIAQNRLMMTVAAIILTIVQIAVPIIFFIMTKRGLP